MVKPARVFDRDQEWADLSEFASAEPVHNARIGLVYGRRRQGKSFLLRALATQNEGIYHQALEEEREPALAGVGALIASDAGVGGALSFGSWSEAFGELIRRADARRPIILDEFPYLVAKSPELPSVIQEAYDAASSGGALFKLILCGSAMSVMSQLLSGQRALRGRVSLELLVKPFDFRLASSFWAIDDPATAFLVDAVAGGTPGYRALLDGPPPRTVGDFEEWLFAGMLNPANAMFRESEYLLTEDPAISDRALYQSVLAAIAEGHTTRSAVGRVLGREDAALRHPLLTLERAGFIRRDEDLWRAKRPLLRLDDPYLRFHFGVVRRNLARFEARLTAEAWSDARSSFDSQVLGPHFEQLARVWTERYASEQTLGGRASHVGFTQLSDADARSRVELDVVAIKGNPNAKRPVVLAIGEAKAGAATRTEADLRKLERGLELLRDRADVRHTRLLLFSRAGFTPELQRAARNRSDVELIDLDRLYGGD